MHTWHSIINFLIQPFFCLEFSKFKKYLLLFSPCSYQFALERIIAPWAIYSYCQSYSVCKISKLFIFSELGDSSHFIVHSLIFSSKVVNASLLFLAFCLL